MDARSPGKRTSSACGIRLGFGLVNRNAQRLDAALDHQTMELETVALLKVRRRRSLVRTDMAPR